MLPDKHVIYGALFTFLVWLVFPSTDWIYLGLLFLSSVFIDVDHYLWYVYTQKDFSLKNAYYFLKEEKDKSRKLMIFHTVEFIIFIGILSYLWIGFAYIFIGLVFHSVLDIIDMTYRKKLNHRRFTYFDTRTNGRDRFKY